ncbi:tyrosine-protein phosphatase siw14 [Madurella fahalii]|uniref:diphosphoinositol-polyphosphate diphosphatase n=1 Tax=Madurella fahalii TaxID=1157608 RepID=A0ABQ0G6U3_9PEZI
MSVGEKVVVSKRSARPYVEYDIEKESHEDQAKRMVKQDETEFGAGGRKYSTSTGTLSSSQSSLEASPLIRAADSEHEVDALVLGAQGRNSSDVELRDAFHPPATNQHVANSIRSLNESLPIEGRPVNFGVVVPGVYRSSFPQSEDYAFIESLKLKTIITLVRKEFPHGYDAFIQKNSIKHCVIDMKGTKKEDIPIKTMKSILRLVLDRRNHPLLIHCNHGKHRTGCVVAVVRKLSGWDLGNIISEYKSYAEPKARECDIKYIMGFQLADISNLFREASWPFRTGRFLRATVFAFFMIIIWLCSGTRIVPTPNRRLLK